MPLKRSLPATVLLLVATLAFGQETYRQDVQHFSYDDKAALKANEVSVGNRGNVKVYDITYAGAGGRVPAYLVVPGGPGRFAAIEWGHWLMPGSAVQNRKEFLAEAIALAPAGVISLLIDAPQNRPGFVEEQDPLGPQRAKLLQQEVVDLRRGVDLLLARSDVDPRRVAYVGHSLGSGAGAVLDAVDKRFAAFVFMGGPQSVRDFVRTSTRPGFEEWRRETPAAKINSYLDTYAWADPATYAAHFGPAPALFQYALQDEWVPIREAKQYLAMVAGPKEVRFYNCGHPLNAAARLDRFDFLRTHLRLAGVPVEVLEQVPPTK